EDCTKDNEPICLAVGPEGSGFPPTFQGLRFRIPMSNPLESYNAAVSAGILLYEWQRTAEPLD
ncbi:MAG: hypothetical protein KDK37_16810, partial [Leptospiraceae bacterium]|nr:hypothetical protein [Leptospiraceae bacterium]